MLTLTNQVNICSFSAAAAVDAFFGNRFRRQNVTIKFMSRKLGNVFSMWLKVFSSHVIHYNFRSFVCLFFSLNASRWLVALRQKRMEYQLEKSITSHDQGETPSAAHKNSRQRRSHRRRHERQQKKNRQLGNHTRHARQRQAHDFNPFETDYVDFGAVIGQNGAFSWHANYLPD